MLFMFIVFKEQKGTSGVQHFSSSNKSILLYESQCYFLLQVSENILSDVKGNI